jgi:hypothetical protein
VYTTRNSLYGTLGLDRVLSGPEARTIIWTSWISKDAEFYLDFKNINLP